MIPVFAPTILVPAAALDAATTAWVAAVVGNGGTVSGARQTLVNSLIVGLKADSIWTKLDRLWLLAAENAGSALTDLVATALATAVNSPTFTTDRGYAGDGSTSYINTLFTPNASGVNYILDSASYGVFDATSRTVEAVDSQMGSGNITNGLLTVLGFGAGVANFGINSNAARDIPANTNSHGMYVVSRTGAATSALYRDGSLLANSLDASSALDNVPFYVCADNTGTGPFGTTDQISAAFLGGGLGATEAANLTTRIQTYMTAVGVP